jgi:hypothetical protein
MERKKKADAGEKGMRLRNKLYAGSVEVRGQFCKKRGRYRPTVYVACKKVLRETTGLCKKLKKKAKGWEGEGYIYTNQYNYQGGWGTNDEE